MLETGRSGDFPPLRRISKPEYSEPLFLVRLILGSEGGDDDNGCVRCVM